ncbi:YHYH protein [Inhella crocodyli]|uniref:YHYH protein n=1 Tax=Inhella crocodyli TaxID=2499851 RepID=UPI0013E397F6|nr:YHYH protein [Inhella crocodyli]
MPAEYSCDGMGSSPALSWGPAPAGTREWALLMSTVPADGSTKYNWVLHQIPAATTALVRDALGPGLTGVGSDGPYRGYQAPCSQGLGTKSYTFTVYALSDSVASRLPAGSAVTGEQLLAALQPLLLGSASLTLSHTRDANSPGLSAACQRVRASLAGTPNAQAAVACDGQYAYVSSTGLSSRRMMDGITATNLQVPTAQNFLGSHAWRIPLQPTPAAAPTSAVDGPIGIAIDGVPLFNPCKQGGCQNGDTKVLGELDVCNGHAGRADDYHYHAAPVCLMADKPASYWDTHPVGWALDGYAILGYNDADGQVAQRDAICGGNTKPNANAPSGYAYHVTEQAPYVLSCFYGVPSPDLAGQSAKFSPMRPPPVTPFPVSGMSLSTEADGAQVLAFTSARSFTTTENGSDAYANVPGSYRIRYRALQGEALSAALATNANRGKSACWTFQFATAQGAGTQPDVTYCR